MTLGPFIPPFSSS